MQDRGNTGKPSPQQRYRESAEERGLAAAARLAAAVAAATSHHPAPAVQAHASAENFRLRRHSTGCRTAPGQPTPSVRQAWTDDRQDAKERPREGPQPEMRARETRQPRVAPGEDAPRVDTSPLRPRLARAQSARRPTRPSAPARARSADPRRRQEGAFGGFVPERREASRNKKATVRLGRVAVMSGGRSVAPGGKMSVRRWTSAEVSHRQGPCEGREAKAIR